MVSKRRHSKAGKAGLALASVNQFRELWGTGVFPGYLFPDGALGWWIVAKSPIREVGGRAMDLSVQKHKMDHPFAKASKLDQNRIQKPIFTQGNGTRPK